MILIAGKTLGHWLGRGDAEAGTGSPYDRYFLLFLACLSLLILYKRRLDWYKAIKDNAWVMMLILYMFLSILWTEIPLTSFKRWFRELIAVVMALLIYSESDPRKALESVLRRSIYVLIPLSFLLVMYFPEYGVESYSDSMDAWLGATVHKNSLGRLCYIAVFLIVWAFASRRFPRNVLSTGYQTYLDILVLGMAVYLLKGPGMGKAVSITSLITLAVGLASLFGLMVARKIKRYLNYNTLRGVIAGIIITGTASVFIGGLIFGGELATNFGREATLTGRTQIWTELIPFVMREPIIGHGIDGFFTDAMKKSLGNLPHAHNGYLNIILDYGFFGLFLVSMFILSSCKKAYRTMSNDYSWGSFWVCFIIMSVVYDIAEPSIDTFTTQQMAIILFLSVSSIAVPNPGKA